MLWLVGCAQLEEPFVWEGESITFVAERSRVAGLCGGTLARLDAYAGALEAMLGEADGPIVYYWRDGEVDANPCGDPGLACTQDRRIFSTSPQHFHEIVHAVAATGGSADPFFAEGLATALGGGHGASSFDPLLGTLRLPSEISNGGSLARMLGYDRTVPIDYGDAGRVVSHLLVRHGVSTFNDFYRETTTHDRGKDVTEKFREAFGVDFGTEAARAQGHSGDGLAMKLAACERLEATPPRPGTDDQFILDRAFECSDPDVQGWWTASTPTVELPTYMAAIDVPRSGTYSIQNRGWSFFFYSCSSPALAPIGVYRPETSVELTPGRYILAASVDGADAVSVRASVAPLVELGTPR